VTLANIARHNSLNDNLRSTCIDFIKVSDLLFDAIREIHTLDTPPKATKSIYTSYFARWVEVVGAYRSVCIIGDAEISRSAKKWFDILASACNPADISVREGSWVESIDEEFENLQSQRQEVRQAFIDAVTNSLNEES
jgi:hypothetical protein